MKSYVKRASKLSVSAHNIEFFTFLSQFACYAFPYFSPACCHTVAMRFYTYSPFVATPLQCVSVHIPYLLPHCCNAFPYIFPICCHTVAMRFHTYSLFVATALQCVSVHIPICCHTIIMRFHTYSPFVATPLQCVSIHIPYLLPQHYNTLVAKWLCKKAKSAMRWAQFGFTKI